jgi:hypothetical protein
MLSLVVPLYSGEENLPRLLGAIVELQKAVLPEPFEVVLVDDGSPDRCQAILQERLPSLPVSTTLVALSRNFGSFAAIAAGLKRARGDYFAVLAADLQEPPQIVVDFLEALRRGEADVVFGVRSGRSDPWLTELTSNLFWATYRRFVVRDMPRGGVDVFACNRMVRDHLLALPEASTNLIALLFWLGFRRKFVSYRRQARLEGRSAWTLKKRLKYAFDSVFNFTDLPVQVLLAAGARVDARRDPRLIGVVGAASPCRGTRRSCHGDVLRRDRHLGLARRSICGWRSRTSGSGRTTWFGRSWSFRPLGTHPGHETAATSNARSPLEIGPRRRRQGRPAGARGGGRAHHPLAGRRWARNSS